VGIRCADHATPSIRKKLALTWATCGGRSVGIVRLRSKATEFLFSFFVVVCDTIRETFGTWRRDDTEAT
jgi:hypothetical protein